MRKADFTASIKKIEICNKVTADSWGQGIRLTLGDIELTNDNLVELRQFRPNEPVKVLIEPEQINLFDVKPQNTTEELTAVDTKEEFVELEEYQPDPPAGTVVKTFKL